MSGDDSRGSGAAARSGGDVGSAAAKVNAPPRDDSVAGEGGGDTLGATRLISLAIGGGGGGAAHSGGEQSDTMHFNRMAFGHLSAGAGIDSREEGGDAARPRDRLPDDDGAADRSGEEEEEEEEDRTWI